jgi:hypothetical protein
MSHLATVGSGSGAAIDISDYNGAFIDNGDCIAVAFGDVSSEGFCSCANGAICVSAKPVYDEDVRPAAARCVP